MQLCLFFFIIWLRGFLFSAILEVWADVGIYWIVKLFIYWGMVHCLFRFCVCVFEHVFALHYALDWLVFLVRDYLWSFANSTSTFFGFILFSQNSLTLNKALWSNMVFHACTNSCSIWLLPVSNPIHRSHMIFTKMRFHIYVKTAVLL